MMLNPGIVYMLVCVVLFTVAVVVHFHAWHLRLPLSPALTVAAAVLPLAGFLNAYIYPNMLFAAHHTTRRLPCSVFSCAASLSSTTTTGPAATAAAAPPLAPRRIAPMVLQGLQALLCTVLATLLVQAAAASPTLFNVLIDREWDALYHHRRDALWLVQEALACCGLRGVDDRAAGDDRRGLTCARAFPGRGACREPWGSATRVSAAIDGAVVLAVGVMQIIGLLVLRERTTWWTALRTQGWKTDYDDATERRLLTNEQLQYGAVEAEEARRDGD